MKKALIKQLVIEAIEATKNNEGHTDFAGYNNGVVKNVIIYAHENSKHFAKGKIGFFYKSCKVFETYQGPDTRRCEIMTFDISLLDCDDEPCKEVYVDLEDDFDGKSDYWADKKAMAQSDREFFDYWT
tara:strand:- start:349 stop:732 length:384 start_codon:yes stop_codon:yes gene_type:complete